jgi:hypothetical protein
VGVPSTTLTLVIASVGAVFFLTWGGWTAYRHCQLWQSRQISFFDFILTLVRTAVMLLLLGYLIR